MSENRSLTAVYTPREAGDGESFWIRLEQEKPEDETLTVAEAAEIIDSLFGIEPCDDGMGGGGEEASEENYPPEEELDAKMAEMLNRAGLCHEAEYWEAVVNVYRSHKQPGYELRSETAEVDAVTPVRTSCRQDVEASGAVIELDMPYDGNLRGIPAGVGWEVRGSTVNLDRPVNARLVLRYDTYYERVTLRVPTDGVDPLARLTAVGEGETKRRRAELPSAAVAAFWLNLAASCDLEPPDQDDSLSADEIKTMCEKGGGGSSGHGGGDSPGDCWAAITHYDRCNCSRKRVNVWTEVVAVSCDEPVEGSVFGGYVQCPEDDDEDLQDPEYYKKRCCKYPPKGLPRCRKSYAVNNGGEPIENGTEHWKNIYGPDVVMVAVMPKDGNCGEIVTEWNIPSKNCCDEVEPLTPSPDNPTTIHAPGSVLLCVQGGKNPREWRASAGYTFNNGKNHKVSFDDVMCEAVYAAEDACDDATIQVDDGCTRIHMALTRDNPWTQKMALSPEDATIAPGGMITIRAFDARGEVQWSGGALRLITPQGLPSATFEAPDNFCGETQVVATDACGEMATASVLSTNGVWVEKFDFNSCYPPWGGLPQATYLGSGCMQGILRGGIYVVDGYQGYKAEVCSATSTSGEYATQPGGCSIREEGVIRSDCGFTGEQMIDVDGPPCSGKSYCDDPYTLYGPMCCGAPKVCGVRNERGNIWSVSVRSIMRLWKWECGNGE